MSPIDPSRNSGSPWPLSETEEEIIAEVNRYSAQNYHPYPFVARRALGASIYGMHGDSKALDLLSGYSSILSHNWEVPRKALISALENFEVDHVSRGIYTPQLRDFVKTLAEMTGYDRILPASDGRSSTEPAVDVCMLHAAERGIEDPEVICIEYFFHGRARTFTTNARFDPSQWAGKGPRVPGIVLAKYDVDDIHRKINKNTIGIIMEVHRGEGGPLFDDGTYILVHRLAREYGIPIIVDEIQTGLYRCGHLMSWQEFGEEFRPDAVVLGKALGGGLIPVSALVGTEEFMRVLTPGTHGSTFGGYPLACVVATATLKYLQKHGDYVGARAQEIGRLFKKYLSDIPDVEVKYRGALIAFELHGTPSAELLCVDMLCGNHNPKVFIKHGHTRRGISYLRVSPPILAITNEQIKEACINTIKPTLMNAKDIVGSGC